MPQASEFFGQDFGTKYEAPVPTQTETPSKSVGQSAAEFFGFDFSAPVERPAPQKQNVDKFDEVFSKLMKQESGGRHTDADGNMITSSKGAQGVTQVMPLTGSDPGFGVKPLQNKSKAEYERFGKDYLNAMLTEFGGDYKKALAAYNFGPGGVKEAITKAGNNWLKATPEETRNYVKNIMGN